MDGIRKYIQGDHSACAKPPADFKTKVPLWPGQAKAKLLFWSQREVLHKLNDHPVHISAQVLLPRSLSAVKFQEYYFISLHECKVCYFQRGLNIWTHKISNLKSFSNQLIDQFQFRSPRSVTMMICTVWLLSFVISMPPLFYPPWKNRLEVRVAMCPELIC